MARREHRGPWLDREPGRPNFYIYSYDAATGRVGRRSTGTDDRRLAEEALGLFIIERAREEKPRGPVQPPERYPISTALRWYGQERAPEIESSVQAGYAIGHLNGFFGKRVAAALTPELVKAYGRKRADQGRAKGTIRREVGVLLAALNHAVANNRLTSFPAITLPPDGKPRTRHLDEDDIKALIDECETPHLLLFAMLALNTGARKGALLDLTWTQVQLEQRLIYLNPEEREETKKGRAIVPISDTLYVALTSARARAEEIARKKNRPICPFVVEYHGGGVGDIKKAFRRACDRAGLSDVSPHTLRHTAGTIMARDGVELFIISKMLGHTMAKTTELYAHHRPEWLRGAAEALGRATKPRAADSHKLLSQEINGPRKK